MNQELPKNVDDVLLSNEISVKDYRDWEKDQKKAEIIAFIQKRFEERYLLPITTSSSPNGFTMMAIGCLLIEALESFHNGWKNSAGHLGKDIFNNFFDRNISFKPFSGYGQSFYTNIRCGILHQAETKGGWIIRRKNKNCILDISSDPSKKVINADEFIESLRLSLDEYCNELIVSDWEDEIWENLRNKMGSIIENCKR